MSAGIHLTLVDINRSDFSFKPDAENNQILYGMKAMLNVGEDIIRETIKNRPYKSPRDFINKVKINKQAMVSLIKGGAFDNMMDRKLCMGWYLWETCDKKKKLNLQNMASLIKYQLIPAEEDEAKRIYEFTRYLKAICKYTTTYYKLDQIALDFLAEMGYDDIVEIENGQFILNIKTWDKVYQGWMDSLRLWISNNQETLLKELNKIIFKEEWDKYATGNLSSWEMEALCFYYHEHELANVDTNRYGFVDFYSLPEDPVVEKTFNRGGKDINIFKLYKICGTCIAKDKNKSTISLLTTNGVVNVKFRKEYFAMFDKQISERGDDGVKHVIQKSWFNRGNMIVVQGIRSGDDFIVKKYQSTGGHQLYRIEEIFKDGSLVLTDSRPTGISEDEID